MKRNIKDKIEKNKKYFEYERGGGGGAVDNVLQVVYFVLVA